MNVNQLVIRVRESHSWDQKRHLGNVFLNNINVKITSRSDQFRPNPTP